MALGVLVVLLPLSWRVIALIALGAIRIIINAYAEAKKLPPAVPGGGEYVYEGKKVKKYKDKPAAGKRGKK